MADLFDLNGLELLAAINQYGSLSAAAAAVGLAQPNASRTLHRLEQVLQRPLLTRHSRGSTLTAEGQRILDYARPLLANAEQFRTQVLQDLTQPLVIGASQTIAETLAGSWFSQLFAQYPQLNASLQVCNSGEVIHRVRAGQVQVGFIESEAVNPGLNSDLIGVDRLVVVVHPGHPWAELKRPISASELAATPLVVRESGSGIRAVLETRLGQPALVALELSSNTAIITAVCAQVAPAVLSEFAIAEAWTTGKILIVPTDFRLTRQLHSLSRPDLVSKLGQELINIASNDLSARAAQRHPDSLSSAIEGRKP